jgi:CheY-like chemotaxis protein
LTGLEATVRLKANARTRGIPILALTGKVTPHGMRTARGAGADDLLSEPIFTEHLISRVQHLHAP